MVTVWHSPLAIKYFELSYWPVGEEQFRRVNPFFVNHLSAGVDIFFCISGFIMCMLVTTGGENRFFNFLSRRLIRIFPMYWLFSFLVVAAYLVNNRWNVGDFSGDNAADFRRTIFSLVLFPQSGSPILDVGWTLVYEMIFYYSIAVLLIFTDGKCVLPWIIFLSIVGILQYSTGTGLMSGHLLNIYFIQFSLGALAYRFRRSLGSYPPALLIIAAVLTYLGVSFAIDRAGIVGEPSFAHVIGYGSVGFLLIAGTIGLERQFTFGTSSAMRFLKLLGDASYILYLSHWFVLSALGKIGGLVPHLPRLSIVLWHIFCVAAAVVFAVAFHIIVEKPLNEQLKRRLGAFEAWAFK